MPNGVTKKCFKTHPPLPLVAADGTEYVIYGGSTILTTGGDADTVIGFDKMMKRTVRSWPWEPGQELCYHITDRRAPKNVANFRKLLAWTWERLEAGDKVYAGCFGGHGRTGLFFAALVATYMEVDSPIAYVREHYCERAVESQEQANFLEKHFGCPVEKPTDKPKASAAWFEDDNPVAPFPGSPRVYTTEEMQEELDRLSGVRTYDGVPLPSKPAKLVKAKGGSSAYPVSSPSCLTSWD